MQRLLCCVLCTVVGCVAPRKSAFVPLFDGASFAGWHQEEQGRGGTWSIDQKQLVGIQGEDGTVALLATENTYKDFIFECEVRMQWPSESGVFLRSGEDGRGHKVTLEYRPGGELGAIYCFRGRGYVCRAPQEYRCEDTPDSTEETVGISPGWHAVRIRVEGEPPLIQFWLDNNLVTDFHHSEATSLGMPLQGKLCLQAAGRSENGRASAVRFRNLRIKELKPMSP